MTNVLLVDSIGMTYLSYFLYIFYNVRSFLFLLRLQLQRLLAFDMHMMSFGPPLSSIQKSHAFRFFPQ